jgi:hypothetical protein
VGPTDVERYSEIIKGKEVVSRIITQYTEVEKADLIKRSDLKTQAENGLVKLYTIILSCLAETR